MLDDQIWMIGKANRSICTLVWPVVAQSERGSGSEVVSCIEWFDARQPYFHRLGDLVF